MATVDTAPRLLLKNILFATDFSPVSDKASSFAAALARKFGSKVLVTHILPEPQPGVAHPDQVSQRDEATRAEAERCLDDFKTNELFRGISHEELLLEGEMLDTINTAIQQKEVDLLVLGTHGRSGLSDIIMGSVAEKILRHISCPVLTVGPKVHFAEPHNVNIERVLFATDLAHGPHALPYATSLAEENDARLIMLHVLQGTVMFDDVVPEEWSENAKKNMREMLPADVALKYEPEFVVAVGTAAEEIVKVATSERADLIVMGVHTGPPSASHAPWAIAHQVIGHASCPVLTVKVEAE
jgi:nucleotide-binding universal stress UspA family protein